MSKKYLVLGGGIAAYSAALKIRELSPEAEIKILTAEKNPPYLRPLLSKTDVKNFQIRKILIANQDIYSEKNIEVITNARVLSIDPEKHLVKVSDGCEYEYDRCVYALGAESFVPPINGADKKSVLTLRNAEDFSKLRRLSLHAENAVVIGGGVIGLETAWELHKLGINCTVLESAPRLMSRQLDEEAAEYLLGKISSVGIKCFTGVQVSAIKGEEKAEAVVLSDGTEFPADIVVLSTGIRPNTKVADIAGLNTGRGLMVDNTMRTSDKDIYAAGDCIQCEYINPGLWGFAKDSGEAAGHNAACGDGEKVVFIPKDYPLIMTAMDTALFAVGVTSASEGISCEVKTISGETAVPRFSVNKSVKSSECFEKRFYRDGKLVGAVLIGDISSMYDILAEI